jgi:hypothetical protein
MYSLRVLALAVEEQHALHRPTDVYGAGETLLACFNMTTYYILAVPEVDSVGLGAVALGAVKF